MQESESQKLQKNREQLEERGYRTYSIKTSRGDVCTALHVNEEECRSFFDQSCSCSFLSVKDPFILAGRSLKDTPTVIELPQGPPVGGKETSIIAGPCSIESEEQLYETAMAVKASGATVLRGGAFKPRTSPYAFQGLGFEGLKMIRRVGDAVGLPVITEVMDADDMPLIAEYVDIIQIGARNCQNFSLLKKAGRIDKPVLLKRGMMVTIDEFLMSAEYILSEGNMKVILCERGIRTFETATRNTLDISAVPVLKGKTHLPVIVDPSHAAGDWRLIEPLALASLAAGADGLMIEAHVRPDEALCDGPQSLRPDKFALLMEKVSALAKVMAPGEVVRL